MDEFRRRPVNRVTRPVNQPGALSQSPTPPQGSMPPQATAPQQAPVTPQMTHQPINDAPTLGPKPPKKGWKKKILWTAIGFLGLVVLGIAGGWLWYSSQLAAVNKDDTRKILVAIETGSTPTQIAATLKGEGVIRSEKVFLWYTRLNGVQNSLQAGSYRLSPAESTPQIVEHLTSGKVDVFDVTLYPGAVLVDTTKTSEAKKLDVTTALKRAGYTEAEIQAGLKADYSDFNATLFQGRPATADLEGYVYGETYRLSSSASVEDVLRASFNEFWKVIQENDLIAKFKAQDLTLYEGITMASIVQRESGGDDKAGIAQVFFSRYRTGEVLGSDVTYQYITDKLGVPRDINYDSPYNTRRFAGLPPGPIASPGKDALIAVGAPATSDYLFFLSGDDNVTYFARTVEEHEANIRNHCQIKCQII